MELTDITPAAWLAAGGLAAALGTLAARRRAGGGARSLAARLAALEDRQSDLGARLPAEPAGDAGEARLQAMASQLLGLVRDKNASLETALAGLDQLRARLRVLEQMGEPAEARALFERLGARLDGIEAAQARAEAGLAARLAALEASGTPAAEVVAELAERLGGLAAEFAGQKELAAATVQTALTGRLGPVETKLGELEGRLGGLDPEAAAEAAAERMGARLAERMETARADQEARAQRLEAMIAEIEGAESPLAEVAERLAALHAQRDAAAEAMAARLGPLEAKLAEIEAALGRLAGDAGADAARAEAQAIAAQLIAARTVAEETRLFANRIALLEASLPRLSMAQALMMQALERQAAPASTAWPLTEPAVDAGAAAEEAAGPEDDAPRRLPRVVAVQKL
jgi:chromosome segregation ATPase